MSNHVPGRLLLAGLLTAALPTWASAQEGPIKVKPGKPGQIIEVEIVGEVGKAVDKAVEGAEAKEIEGKIAQLRDYLAKIRAAQQEKELVEQLKRKAAELQKMAEQKAAEEAKRAAEAREKMLEYYQHIRGLPAGEPAKPGEGGVRVWAVPEGGPAKPTVKVYDAKGNELTDVRVEFVHEEPKPPAAKPAAGTFAEWTQAPMMMMMGGPAAGDEAIALTRKTYKLPKDKAALLDAVLKQCKAKVLEVKAEGDSVTVTTTPDVQHTIGGLVGLLAPKRGVGIFAGPMRFSIEGAKATDPAAPPKGPPAGGEPFIKPIPAPEKDKPGAKGKPEGGGTFQIEIDGLDFEFAKPKK